MKKEERRRGEKTKKTLTMQLWAHEERENEWTTCSGGILLAGFRGVEISYNVRDVCVDSFNSLPSRGGYRKPLLVGPSIHKTTMNCVLERDIREVLSGFLYLFFSLSIINIAD